MSKRLRVFFLFLFFAMPQVLLAVLFICFICGKSYATEKILYPNANGLNQSFIPNTGTDHYPLVDDPHGSSDGDTTYLYKQSLGVHVETEGLQDCGTTPDSILDNAIFDSVYIHLQAKWAVSGDDNTLWAYIRWVSLGAEYIAMSVGAGYTDILKKSTKSMASVTKTELNGTEAGMRMDAYVEFQGTIRLTQVHLHVWYHLPAVGGRGHPITRDDEDNKGILEGGITR